MKRYHFSVCVFLSIFFYVLFNVTTASADWAPGSNIIQDNHEDSKSSYFTLALDDTIQLEVDDIELVSLDIFGGWDVGYDYHFYYNFGEGIDVASDGWSNPQLMTKADLDIGARAWLNLIGPGILLDLWVIGPVEIDLLSLLGVNSKIDEEINISDQQFSLPFTKDNSLVDLTFNSGIYNEDYSNTIFIDLAAKLGFLATGKIGVVRGLTGNIAFWLDSIDYYNGSTKIGRQNSSETGVDVSEYAGESLSVDIREYIFKLQPSFNAGVALFAEFGIMGYNIATYYPPEGSEPPHLINADFTVGFETPPIPIEWETQYAVPSTGDDPNNISPSPGDPNENQTTIVDSTKPTLTNPRVSPSSGTESQIFEFLVDYYDPNGDPPLSEFKKIILSDGSVEQMTLKSGSEADGTYSYQTELSNGTYSFYFSFANTSLELVSTNWKNGPDVFTDENLVIKPVIECTKISSDLKFGYSLTGLGDWIYIPIEDDPNLDPIVIPSGSTIYFTTGTESENFTYNSRELWHNGNLESQGTGSGWWTSFSSTASGEYTLKLFYQYTPQNYEISGTVLRKDETPITEGVQLELESSEQNISQNINDGIFSFTNIKGGVPVTIEFFADGYAFTPSSLTYNNLKDNQTDIKIIAYASDFNAPTIMIEDFPPKVNMVSTILFSWSGQDDVSSASDLQYQYMLKGLDSDWSEWDTINTKSYELSNGSYTFWLRVKDEAGNINQAPLSYTFAVNAAPTFVSATRINRSVWASRITLKMPADATNTSNEFVILPDHSGIEDAELVPVQIHHVDEITIIGVNEIIAEQSELTTSIKKVDDGWLITLPETIPLGQTMQYDIIWGKIAYFGWQEFTDVPTGFSNGENISEGSSAYLDDELRLWKYAKKKIDLGGKGNSVEMATWLFMNLCDNEGCIINEQLMRFIPGITTEYLDDDPEDPRGVYYVFYMKPIVGTQGKIFFPWHELKEEWNAPKYDRYSRYSLQLFDTDGSSLAMKDGDYIFKTSNIVFSEELINGIIWVAGGTSGDENNNVWFLGLDENGNEVTPKTDFDDITNENDGNLSGIKIKKIGSNTLFLWERSWQTSGGKDRQELRYIIVDKNGAVVKQKTCFHDPVGSDSDNYHDRYLIDSCLTDNEGKVWISFTHESYETGAYAYNRNYVILDTDGSICQGPEETQGNREFLFCDKDGYIWTNENDQIFILNSDNIIAVPARGQTWMPNQNVGEIAANVSSTGYRLYDRWSLKFIGINIPTDVNPISMEVYDLDLWDNDLHPANVNLKKGEIDIWSQDDQFTDQVSIDISGTLDQGSNILTITQDDLLGGQLLITFPYVVPPSYSVSGKVSLKGGTPDISDVILTLEGESSNSTIPDSNNEYSFYGLDEGAYTIIPSLSDYYFFPNSILLTKLNSDLSNQNFIGLHAEYDSDSDDLFDWWEQNIINADINDDIKTVEDVVPEDDFDNDGLSNLGEQDNNTDPTIPDTDGDSFNDYEEIIHASDPTLNKDTIYDHRPYQPEILAVDVEDVPLRNQTFEVDGFGDPDQSTGDYLSASEWQIRIDQDSVNNNIIFQRMLERESSDSLDENECLKLLIHQAVLIKEKTYWIRTRHMDSTGLWSPWSDPLTFKTIAVDPNDTDENGIDDDYQVQGYVDTNNNGTDDHDENILVLYDAEEGAIIGISTGEGELGCLNAIPTSEIPNELLPSVPLPNGFFSFRVDGLPVDIENPSKVDMIFYFNDPLPEDIKWYTYDPFKKEMIDLSADIFVSGNTIVLQLTDGGPSDLDGTVNGIIIEQSGPAFVQDVDNDGLPDDWEKEHFGELSTADDTTDTDIDDLLDIDEYAYKTDPNDKDTDDDDMPDGWEVEYSLDPLINDASDDPDEDGLSNLIEYKGGTDPTLEDTDNDSILDGNEDANHNGAVDEGETDPCNFDTDNDDMPDGWEVEYGLDPLSDNSADDYDVDGVTDLQEYQNGTDPTSDADTDKDDMPDDWEIAYFGDIIRDGSKDYDDDELNDLQEYKNETNPTNSDTDGDNFADGYEVAVHSDPNSASDTPENHKPDKPVIEMLTPDDELFIYSLFVVNEFIDPDDDSLISSEWQISADEGFSEDEIVFYKVLEIGTGIMDEEDYLLILEMQYPVFLPDTDYWIRVMLEDSTGLWSLWSDSLAFHTLMENPYDLDNNGVDDSYQVDGDTDTNNNGIVDSEEGITALYDAEQGEIVGVSAGQGSISGLTSLSTLDLPEEVVLDRSMPYGLFSYRIDGLAQGETVDIDFYFPDEIPSNAKWYKYDSADGTLIDFTENVVFSGNSAVLSITDGDLGDWDETINSIIIDPSGLAFTTGIVSTPTFSPSPGTYESDQSVSISCETSDATIRYTTDGDDPTEDSSVYSSDINISSTTTIKAKSFKTGWEPSDIATGTYTIEKKDDGGGCFIETSVNGSGREGHVELYLTLGIVFLWVMVWAGRLLFQRRNTRKRDNLLK